MLEQNPSRQRHQQIRVGDAGALCALDFGNVTLRPILVERSRLRFHVSYEEVRNGGPALYHAFSHKAADSARHFDLR